MSNGLLNYISLVVVWPLHTIHCIQAIINSTVASPFILWMHVYSQVNGSFSTSSVLFHFVIESLQSLLDS